MVPHNYNGIADTTPTVLLVWDAPNVDMGLGAILGARPTAAHRPRFDAIGRWLVHRTMDMADDMGTHIEPEATVFTNIAPGSAEIVRPWVEALRNVGFAVFAKPKIGDDSDVDPDMLAHIRRRRDEGILEGVVVASADGQNFQDTLEELERAQIPTTVIGFREHAAWAVNSDVIEFIDLESLPDEGAWLQPFRSLTSLLKER